MPASDILPTDVLRDYNTVTSHRLNLPHHQIRAAATMLFADHRSSLETAGIHDIAALHRLLDDHNTQIIRNMKKLRKKSQHDYDNRHTTDIARAVALMVAQHQPHQIRFPS